MRGVICSVVALTFVGGGVAAGGSAAPVKLPVHVPLHLAAVKKPTIVSVSATPILVPSSGGTITVSVSVRGATSCVVSGQRRPSGPYIAHAVSCSSGHAKLKFPVLAATSRSQQTINFRVRALRPGKKPATSSTSVTQAPAQPPPPPEAPAITTTDLPEGALNGAYSAQLAATSGKPPYAWTVAGGSLPTGVTLSTTGLLSGTPTVPGDYVVTVEVSDANHLSVQGTLILSIDGPALLLTTPVNGLHSHNWSGYAVNGGPFTYVSGTFNVVGLTPSSTNSVFAEWVGIDGATNSTVLQAGINEDNAAGSSFIESYAWYELYPAPPQILPFAFQAGDQITVTISELAANTWNIRVKDQTNGQQVNQQVSYSSALSSAEWIMEAPADGITNNILTLGQYTPNVTFTKLLVSGPQSTIDSMQMVQGGNPVSTPSPLSANGFSIAYGSGAPSAP